MHNMSLRSHSKPFALQGGGILIEGSSTDVTIATAAIFQNAVSGVSCTGFALRAHHSAPLEVVSWNVHIAHYRCRMAAESTSQAEA